MEQIQYLIIGAGVTGLAFANFISSDDYLILEADSETGGYCKTIKQNGFVWDYSGHFFHFKHPELESYLLERMPEKEVCVVQKKTGIYFKGVLVDFPFQKNIHQLPKELFITCLYDLFFKEEQFPDPAENFREMLYKKFGEGISDAFLVPYNEKLYATDLARLDVNAMGRFFPFANLKEIIRNFKRPDNDNYNATFTYPRGGAIEYVKALQNDIPLSQIALQERVIKIDLANKIAHTSQRKIRFENLISTMPFPDLLAQTDLATHQETFSYNKVLVFNLGFDRKGWTEHHWLYFPNSEIRFYRVGFYDNIIPGDRMSLYVEIGLAADARYDVEKELQRVLKDLRKVRIITEQVLTDWHHVIMDPAYVHITAESLKQFQTIATDLATKGIFSIGRYGGWTYCSIEDNILEAKKLAETLNLRPLPKMD